MEDPKLVQHKGKDIVLNDYSGLRGEDLRNMIDKMVDFNMTIQNPNYLLLVDFTDCSANAAVVQRFKSAAVQMKPIIDKTAVVGIRGVQQVLVNAVLKFAKIQISQFDTREKAKDWLVD